RLADNHNEGQAVHEKTVITASKMNMAIIDDHKRECYIKDYVDHEDGKQGEITVFLRYENGRPVIRRLRRVSRPGLRRYVGRNEIPRVLGGLGISILSTSKGVMVDREARKAGVGGELLCTVY